MPQLVKISAVVLIFLFVLPTNFFFAFAESEDENLELYKSYKDIPGVTQEEIDAVEHLKSLRSSFQFATPASTEGYFEKDGSINGFVVTLSEEFSKLFGVEFIPKVYGRPELLAGLDDKSIDFSCGIAATPEISAKYLLTQPIMKRDVVIYRAANSAPLERLAQERKLKYAFVEAAQIHNQVQEKSTIPFDYQFVTDYAEAHKLLIDGTVDAFVIDNSAKIDFDEYADIVYENFLPSIQRNVPILTGNEDLKPIISMMEKYLENGGQERLHKLYDMSQIDYQRNKLGTFLTPEESAYIRDHINSDIAIPYLASSDNYPICFYNKNVGEYQGVSIDVLAKISELTGLRFETSNEVGTPWYQLYASLEKGEAAFVPELLYTQERAEKFIWPESGYSYDAYALISQVDTEEVMLENIGDYKVGIISETAYANLFKQWFPNQEGIVEFASYEPAFNALGHGEIDLLMGTKYLLLNITNYLERPGYKANYIFDYESRSSFGFPKDEKILCSIISKSQDLINTQDIAERWSLKVFDYNQKLEEERRPYIVGAVILAALVIILMVVLVVRNRNINKKLETIVETRTAQLAQQTQTAEIASKAKGDFLARMSHEIRTPLNAILGMAGIAKKTADQSESNEKLSSNIGEIITASTHLLGILNDVLDMSKIEAGKLWLADGVFGVRSAMEEVCIIIKQRCEEGELNFTTNIDDLENLMIIGDKLRLKQVLINLLGNAVKFTPKGGEIKFIVDLEKRDSKAHLTFTVQDTGIGISEDQKKKLFQAFEQCDGSISTKYGGTGLGLSISQSIVNHMGGVITVDSEPGKGSTFSFSIRPDIAEAIENDLAPEINVDLEGKRILIVEDVEINRIIITELLGDTKIDIVEAVDGVDGVEKFVNSPASYFDLIFMDIQMPNMNGYTATEKIRVSDHPDALSIPIVAMTANAYTEDVEHALASGMNAHLAKPVDINLVKKLLKTILLDGGKKS